MSSESRGSLELKKMEEMDLNKKSIDAATFYLKKQMGTGVPIDVQQNVLNYVAAGFFMGYRKAEEEHGITN